MDSLGQAETAMRDIQYEADKECPEGLEDRDEFELVGANESLGANNSLVLYGVQVDKNKYVSVQRNAAHTKGVGERLLPKPVVIRVIANGVPVRALVDSGSLGDFNSQFTVLGPR